jgi:hypothetical protein
VGTGVFFGLYERVRRGERSWGGVVCDCLSGVSCCVVTVVVFHPHLDGLGARRGEKYWDWVGVGVVAGV